MLWKGKHDAGECRVVRINSGIESTTIQAKVKQGQKRVSDFATKVVQVAC